MKKQIAILALISAALLTSACSSDTNDVLGHNPPQRAKASEITFSMVKKRIFDKYNCSSCHSATEQSGGVILTTYDVIMSQFGLIVPGDANNSLVYHMISTGQMPKIGPPVSALDQQFLRTWINAGAHKNGIPDEEVSPNENIAIEE